MYDIYISESKISSLYPKIPMSEKRTIKSEISANLGFFKAARIEERADNESHQEQLEVIKKYILKKMKVGSIDNPETWIEGQCKVKIHEFSENENIVFFLGKTASTRFALGGSLHHIVGDSLDVSKSKSMSFGPRLVNALEKRIDDVNMHGDEDEIIQKVLIMRASQKESAWAQQIIQMIENENSQEYKVKFLAKKLLDTQYGDYNYILGTPLYVSMV